MPEPTLVSHVVHFGVFEADLRSGELRKHGLRLKIQEQPFRVLAMLLEQPGQVVTREELRKRLWPADTFVDFEHGLNAAINKLREVLGDSPDTPRFVETLRRRGYRFIAPVEVHAPPTSIPERMGWEADHPPGIARSQTDAFPHPGSGGGHGPVEFGAIHKSPLRQHWRLAAIVGVVIVTLAATVALTVPALRNRIASMVGAGSARPRASKSLPYPRIESIAVLPFENLSRDPDQEYFADGMTEELITNLGKISALRVISRTSVLRYKGTNKPLPEIAKELNVDAIVEGTVLRSGSRVRVTANLLHAPTDRHLWAETYERDLGDVLALQDELARALAKEINIAVTPHEQTHLASARSVNPEAYEAYLKGRTVLDNLTEESGQSAIQYFERAIERDSAFAPAFAGLADAYIFQGRFHYLAPNEIFREAKQAVAKTLALDPKSAEAYATLCSIATFYDWDWRGAEMACRRAIELNPSYGPAHHMYSHYFISSGRFVESLRESRSYLELDPLSPAARTHLGTHYKMARQYDLAIEELRKTVELAPNFPDAYGELASSYIGKGEYQEAFSPARKAVMLTGGKGYLGLLGEAYAMAGRRSEAIKVLEEIRGMSRGRLVPARSTVPVLIALGEKDRAIEVLQRAFEEHDQLIPYLKVWSMFDPLRSDPRFQDLLRRMNFPR